MIVVSLYDHRYRRLEEANGLRSVKAKIRALTRKTSQQDLEYVLTSLNMVMHGWANYFRHAVAKNTFGTVENFTWWRLIRMLRERHHWTWSEVRRRFVTVSGQWRTAYGRFLGMLHAMELPGEVAGLLQTETYASTAPYRVRALAGPAAADPALGPLWRRHREKLSAWADEVERLERDASADPAPTVVCHADIHPGDLLADGDDLRVVDWDAPIRGPRERDLMFVFGADFGEHPINARREALFRAGYGPLGLDDAPLHYYRLERRLDDVALCAATVLDESATETAQAHELELPTRILES